MGLNPALASLILTGFSIMCLSLTIPTCRKAFGYENFIYTLPVNYAAFEFGQIVLFLGTTPLQLNFWVRTTRSRVASVMTNSESK